VRDLRAWLFRVARNTAISNLRGPGHLDPPELLDTLVAAPSPQEEAERREVIRETLEAVAGLPERQRDALLRIAVQGRSQDEVAEELGVSRVAVRQLVHRARTAVRTAASAVVPFPVVTWLASAGSGEEPVSLRIAQLVAGAGGAGAGAAVLKAGAVAGVAAGVTAPLLAEHHPVRATPARATPALTATPRAVPAEAVATATPRAIPIASIVPAKPHSAGLKPAAGAGAGRQAPTSAKRDAGASDRSRHRGSEASPGSSDALSTPGAGDDGQTTRREGDQAAKSTTDAARPRHDDGSSADGQQSQSAEDQSTQSAESLSQSTAESTSRGDGSSTGGGELSVPSGSGSSPSGSAGSSEASGD
jgi:DNA-binding CsgD family transcriptional regulator